MSLSNNLSNQLSPLLYMGKSTSAQSCPMKYFWSHYLHLMARNGVVYLDFGSTFHQLVLELGLKYKSFELPEAVLNQNYRMAEVFTGEAIASKIVDSIEATDDTDKALMAKMLPAIAEKWNAEFSNVEVIHIETSFVCPLPVPNPFFTSWIIKPDFIFRDEQGLWIGDLKTTAGYGPATAKYYHNAYQTKTYFYLLKKYFFPELLGTKIFIATKQKIRCEVEEIHLTDADMYQAELFITETLGIVTRLYESNTFERDMSECIDWMGKECPYIPICTMPITSQVYLDDLLQSMYEIKSPDEHLEMENAIYYQGE